MNTKQDSLNHNTRHIDCLSDPEIHHDSIFQDDAIEQILNEYCSPRNKRLHSELNEDEKKEFLNLGKKRKLNHSLPKCTLRLNDKQLYRILSFLDVSQHSIISLRVVSTQWNRTMQTVRWDRFSSEVYDISNQLFVNNNYWSNNKSFRNATLLIKQKKSSQSIIAFKKLIPFKKYLVDIESPDTFYVDDPFEFCSMRYGNDVHQRKSSIKLIAKNSYTKPTNRLVYAIVESKQYPLAIEITKRVIEKYNPVSVFLRLQMIECFKIQKNMSDLFYWNYDCLKLSYKLKDVGRCFLNFAFYFVEIDNIECAIACLCKSARFHVTISIVKELNHIQAHIIKPKIINLKNEQNANGCCDTSNREKKRLENINTLCDQLKKKFIDFVSKYRLAAMPKNLFAPIPRNLRSNIITTTNARLGMIPLRQIDRTNAITPTASIQTKSVHHSQNQSSSSQRVSSEAVIVQPSNSVYLPGTYDDDDIETSQRRPDVLDWSSLVICNPFTKDIGIDNRTCYPVMTFDEDHLRFIDKYMEKCEISPKHRKLDARTNNMKLDISDKILGHYRMIRDVLKKDKHQKDIDFYSLKISKPKNASITLSEFKKLKLVWNDCSFLSLSEMNHYYKTLLDSRIKSKYSSFENMF